MKVPAFRRKLLWLVWLRAATVTLLLGSAILVQVSSPGTWPVNPFFLIIALTYAVTAIHALTLKWVERHRWMLDLQLGIDALTISALTGLSGGVTSYFSSLYVLPILAGSILRSRRGGVAIAALSTATYALLVAAQYDGMLIFPGEGEASDPLLPPIRLALYTVGINIFGFFAVALLSGYLAENLRRADASLQQASNELADLQAFNQDVIQSLTSGLVTTDVNGKILTFNRAAETITGQHASSVVGQPVVDVLHLPLDFKGALETSFEGPGSRRCDFTFTRSDGRRIDMGLSAAPLITPGGRTGVLLSFQDVTESHRLEREARMQQRLAAVGEMAAGIAHEIRNPLASMSGSIQILRQELSLSEEQAQLMDIVLRESERLNNTIRSFLAYARPQRFATKRLDLGRVLSDTAMLLRNSSECGDQHLVELDMAGEVWYVADEAQMRQIVWNLATNGLRAMPDGGTLRLCAGEELTADPSRGKEAVFVAVRDQGVGMSAEELDQIFQPFHGAFAKGSGLGLAIVHRIVSDYGGEIQVTSEPGTGTTVRVRLPVPVTAPAA